MGFFRTGELLIEHSNTKNELYARNYKVIIRDNQGHTIDSNFVLIHTISVVIIKESSV